MITTDEAREWLGIQDHVPGPVESLKLVVGSVERAVNDYCGRTWAVPRGDAEATARTFDGGCRVTYVDDFTSIETIEQSWDDEATWSTFTDTYRLGPRNDATSYQIITRYGLAQSVRVTAVWGQAEIPDSVKLAAQMKVAKLWKRRDTPNGIEGVNDFGIVRISRTEDPDICDLLGPHRRMDRVAGIA